MGELSLLPFGCLIGFVSASRGGVYIVKTQTAIISIVELNSQVVEPLRALLKAIPGVESVDFSIERKVAVAEFDPTKTHVDELLRAVLKAGFRLS